MLQNAVASGSVMRPGADHDRDQGGVSRREGRRAGASRQGCRPRRREGRHPRPRWIRCKIAEGPKDVARAARLAESKGGQTRAILKLLGRGALLLAAGAFNLTLWVFGALLALFGLLSSIKATTERLTMSWLLRKKARRLRKQMAAAALASDVSARGRRRPRLASGLASRPSIPDPPPNHGMTDAEFSQRRC